MLRKRLKQKRQGASEGGSGKPGREAGLTESPLVSCLLAVFLV